MAKRTACILTALCVTAAAVPGTGGYNYSEVFAAEEADENMFLMVSEQLFNISGMNSTLNPKEKLNAITSVAFLFIFWEAIIRIPAAATVPNISSVAPPRTGSGINENTSPTAGKSPSITKKAAI